jgi:cbb3-type cytochrome oxidase subunit 3
MQMSEKTINQYINHIFSPQSQAQRNQELRIKFADDPLK